MIICDYCNTKCRLDENLHCMNCGAPMLPGARKPIAVFTSKEPLDVVEAKRMRKMLSRELLHHKNIILSPHCDLKILQGE